MGASAIAAAGINAVFGLFGASNAQKRENAAREQAAREAQQAARDDRAALTEQREFDLAAYNMQRADLRADYDRQRADASADYDRQRADAVSDTENQFVRLRAAAEKGGFNPLAILQGFPAAGQVASVGLPSPGMSSVSMASGAPISSRAAVGYISPTNYVGGALGDAAMLLGDAFASAASMSVQKKWNDWESTRKAASGKAAASVRPKVGGVYSKPDTPRFGLGVAQGAARDVAMPDPVLNRHTGSYTGGQYTPGVSGWSPNTVYQQNNGEYVASVRGVGDYVLTLPHASRNVSDAAGWTKPGKSYRENFVPIPGTSWALPWPRSWTADVTAKGKTDGARYMGGIF